MLKKKSEFDKIPQQCHGKSDFSFSEISSNTQWKERIGMNSYSGGEGRVGAGAQVPRFGSGQNTLTSIKTDANHENTTHTRTRLVNPQRAASTKTKMNKSQTTCTGGKTVTQRQRLRR
ncbi:hypothetical protein CEXT_227071 [Caerostris extrusa]|uniref:Uncharacterized protein n=1 Tax=Caerostris extrusa TaxID=172846 RepID=A0AAV4NDT0_CAEEX|nr:hypothetical protein CEXT_227071 [Caerostris extrusa]